MQMLPLILLCGGMMLLLAAASFFSKNYSLDRIKSKPVGDGQHGYRQAGNGGNHFEAAGKLDE